MAFAAKTAEKLENLPPNVHPCRQRLVLSRVIAGGAITVGASAACAQIRAVVAHALVVVARGARAICVVAGRTVAFAVRAVTGDALVVVAFVLVVQVSAVQVVHVVFVNNRLVATARTVCVAVFFGSRAVNGRSRHRVPPCGSKRP